MCTVSHYCLLNSVGWVGKIMQSMLNHHNHAMESNEAYIQIEKSHTTIRGGLLKRILSFLILHLYDVMQWPTYNAWLSQTSPSRPKINCELLKGYWWTIDELEKKISPSFITFVKIVVISSILYYYVRCSFSLKWDLFCFSLFALYNTKVGQQFYTKMALLW